MADHKHLVGSEQTRALFDLLGAKVLALDPCVTEEFAERSLYRPLWSADIVEVVVPRADYAELRTWATKWSNSVTATSAPSWVVLGVDVDTVTVDESLDLATRGPASTAAPLS